MRPEDRLRAHLHGEAAGDDDDLRARFPDPNTDERLRAPDASELPPVPEVTFTRPNTRTARGNTAPIVPIAGNGETRSASEAGDGGGGYRNMGIASTIGFSLVTSILSGALLGFLADRYVLHSGTTPWGLIVGLLLGVVAGFINLLRVTKQLDR